MFVSVFAIVSHAAAYYHIYLHSIGGFKNILTENIGRSRMGMSGEIPPDSDNSDWGENPHFEQEWRNRVSNVAFLAAVELF